VVGHRAAAVKELADGVAFGAGAENSFGGRDRRASMKSGVPRFRLQPTPGDRIVLSGIDADAGARAITVKIGRACPLNLIK
jgi:hypothetical protein